MTEWLVWNGGERHPRVLSQWVCGRGGSAAGLFVHGHCPALVTLPLGTPVTSRIPPDSAMTQHLGSPLGCTLGGHFGHVCAPSISAAIPVTAHTGLPPHPLEQARTHTRHRAPSSHAIPPSDPLPPPRGRRLPVRSPGFRWVRLVRTVTDGAVPQLSWRGKRRGRGDLLCLLLLSTRDVIQNLRKFILKLSSGTFQKSVCCRSLFRAAAFRCCVGRLLGNPPTAAQC